jgi:NTP pyrophosphatase (non-canonical NTP hydrolase)
MSDIKNLQQQISQFSEERDWDQFHNGKDLAIGLSIEASELLETFLWKAPEDVIVEKVREELADVFNYALQIATKYDLDVKQIVEEKLAKNAAKYPVEKAKGVATKYDEL